MRQSAYDPSNNRPAWNTNRKLRTKRKLKLIKILAIRFMLDQASQLRDRAHFDLVIDSQLRRRILGKIRIGDSVAGVRGRS